MDPIWEKLHQSQPWGKYPAIDLVQFVMRRFKNQPTSDKKVLELGCGGGANLSFLLNEGFQSFGIDGAPSAIEKTQQRLGKLVKPGQTLDLRAGNFVQLPWTDSSFDAVLDYFSVYANTMADIQASFQEASRVLKPGGVIFSRLWGVGTEGYNTGEMLEAGTSKNPTVGPCAGFGVSHFFTEEELYKVFSPFQNLQIHQITTEQKRPSTAPKVVEWIVTGEKA